MQPHEQLEQKFAEWNGLDPRGMVACSSGTAALHLALEAFRVPLGSRVIVPDYTMIACPRAVTLASLTPVLVDCRGEDLLMDPLLLAKAVTDVPGSVSAVMWVSVYGRVLETDREYVARQAEVTGTWMIEDLAEAHGLRPHPKTDAACWSFYRNKVIGGAEGGAVWFKYRGHADLARRLRSLGFDHEPPECEGAVSYHDYSHAPRGHNYRLSNVHAQLVLDSLARVLPNVVARRCVERMYDDRCPTQWRQPERLVPWVYDLRIAELWEGKQEQVVRALNREGIAARPGFKPVHTQREYRDCRKVGGEQAEAASREVICLPVTPDRTTEDDVAKAFEVIHSHL